MRRRLAVALVLLGLLAACSDDDGVTTTDQDASGVRFVDVTHGDGTKYRCLYTYEGHGYHGGPAMWCERRQG